MKIPANFEFKVTNLRQSPYKSKNLDGINKNPNNPNEIDLFEKRLSEMGSTINELKRRIDKLED